MYSIFGLGSKKPRYLEKGEPPPKKLVTDGDVLIKKLSKDQLNTNITLEGQLNKSKEFTPSETFVDVTSQVSGATNLDDFQKKMTQIAEVGRLRYKGLSNRDIAMYEEYVKSESDFWNKYKDVNKDVLKKHIEEITQIVNDNCTEKQTGDFIAKTSRHEEEYLDSLNPQNIETKLLKFAAHSQSKVTTTLPGPMDDMPQLERDIMNNIHEFTQCDLKKIRKKARSLANKIQELANTEVVEKREVKAEKLQRKSLWDSKETPDRRENKAEIVDKDKVYTCKSQNWYTIIDGKIVKLSKDEVTPEQPDSKQKVKKTKLTVEEIKSIPKFSNYEPGNPTNTVFLKNLGRKIDEEAIRKILEVYPLQEYAVKIMSGKIKGQAFVEFQDESQAAQGLEALNGVLIDERPIIAAYGKKKTA